LFPYLINALKFPSLMSIGSPKAFLTVKLKLP